LPDVTKDIAINSNKKTTWQSVFALENDTKHK